MTLVLQRHLEASWEKTVFGYASGCVNEDSIKTSMGLEE